MKTGIDIADYILAKKEKWHLNTNGYYRNSKTKVYLHHFILGKLDNMVCDHINRNKIDNRKSNLRHVTRLENNLNNDFVINSKGVYFDKHGNRWRACISIKNKTIKLGSFKSKDEAVLARNNAISKYRKNLAR
jgi:hypothetical protein